MLADEFAQTIAERRSVGPKQQTHNAPSDDVFVRAARAARSAPSHNPFFPCRFVKVVSREKLADVFESALPPEADQVLRDRARSKALKGAACIVIIGPKPTPDTPVIMDMENLMTAGGALTNFLNVLWAEGVAAKTLTSREIKDPQGLFDPKTERLLGFILCGLGRAGGLPQGADAAARSGALYSLGVVIGPARTVRSQLHRTTGRSASRMRSAISAMPRTVLGAHPSALLLTAKKLSCPERAALTSSEAIKARVAGSAA